MIKGLWKISILSFILFSSTLNAQGVQSKPAGSSSAPSTSVGPSSIVRPPLGQPRERFPSKSHENKRDLPEKPSKYSYRPTFTEPGIVALQGGGLQGVDHLFNLKGSVPVVVEIVKSDNLNTTVSDEKIQRIVEDAFRRGGIDTNIQSYDGATLPFFHVLVMIIPSGEGVSAFCAGRLFEKVTIDRVVLPYGVNFQAITWEFQNIISSSKEEMERQVETTVLEIAQQFVNRHHHYQSMNRPQ